jgi:DNA (cytosine-5)-methyltransferase 1
MKNLKSIEIFSGAGGLALGLENSGFFHELLVEKDKNSCSNLRYYFYQNKNIFLNNSILESDIRECDFSQYKNKLHLVAGGPPCQPFSLGGKHLAFNDKRDMFPEAVRVIKEVKPKAFIFENVKGLLRKTFSTYFNYIILQLTYPDINKKKNEIWMDHLKRLEKHHLSTNRSNPFYNVIFRLVNSADYGVPQIRYRVLIIGFRNDQNTQWSFPDTTHSIDGLLISKYITKEYWDFHKLSSKHFISPNKTILKHLSFLKSCYSFTKFPKERWLTVRDAISDLPDPRLDSAFTNHEFRNGARSYTGHTGSHLDDPSKTLKAGNHGVPGGENTIVQDDKTIRYYTVRESARIQTFPDDYVFFGSWTENMRQIGNAVPVKLAEIIGKSIYQNLY